MRLRYKHKNCTQASESAILTSDGFHWSWIFLITNHTESLLCSPSLALKHHPGLPIEVWAGVLSQLAQQISYTAVDEWNFYFFLLNQKSSDQCVRLHRSVIASGVGNFGFFRVVVYCDVTCGVKSK